MRRHRIRALAGRRFRPCTTDSRHYLPIAPNLLAQNFVATAPNRIWLADITYIATGEGWLYLAAVLDFATRKIVGWALRSEEHTSELQSLMRISYAVFCLKNTNRRTSTEDSSLPNKS